MSILVDGNSKQILSTESENNIIIKFKDKVSCSYVTEPFQLKGKAVLSQFLNKYFFSLLDGSVPHHVVEFLNDTAFIARKLRMLPVIIAVRNFAAGSICERKNYERGEWFAFPLIEYFVKTQDGILEEISEDEIVSKNILTFPEIDLLLNASRYINKIIYSDLNDKGLVLADIKLSFGRNKNGFYLADELTPATMRIWDKQTRESLDRDVLLNDNYDLIKTYTFLAERLGITL